MGDLMLFGVLLAVALGHALTEEEWRVGPEFLSVRKTLVGYTWGWQALGRGRLFVSRSYGYRNRHWRLRVESPSGRRTLLRGGFVGAGQLVQIGQFLAARTGWPLDATDASMSWWL